MASPPALAGADQLTVSCREPGTNATPVAGAGVVRGVPATRGLEGTEVPATFVATTSTWAVTPLARDPMEQLVVVEVHWPSRLPPVAES